MIYRNEYLNEISFPIGGIGTGCFGIAGNGRFVDWEIFNRPAKGTILGFTHIALRAKTADGRVIVKVLNGDVTKELTGTYFRDNAYHGFGFGPGSEMMVGLPHFRHVEFNGEFPIAKLTFKDEDFPADVVLTVFNPLIPLDAYNSSLPAGFFNIDIVNTVSEDIEYSVFFSVTNTFAEAANKVEVCGARKLMTLVSGLDRENVDFGEMSLCTNHTEPCIQRYWYRGPWCDPLDVFMNELISGGELSDRVYDEPSVKLKDTATMQVNRSAKKGERINVRFVLSWNVPNNCDYWSNVKSLPWKNYYATQFESSADTAVYCMEHFDELYARTLRFKDTLFTSTLDKAVIDAVSSTMSVLKSPTVLRLEDGSFYGWEGVKELSGSCEGTCQHVWNYAYALCFLFPELERSIRDNEFQHCLAENGATRFRMALPVGTDRIAAETCLDGQMGIVFKTYREWKIGGDSQWLCSVWDHVKSVLSYAWNPQSPWAWDANKDGVLEGRQHHTLDMELFGPSSWLEGMYLCALKAAGEMADHLGDTEASAEYKALFEQGYEWSKKNLFNGEYFIQKIDLGDDSPIKRFNCPNYWYEEGRELKYQIGDGCEIDQLLGQWHADILGLGELFDKDQTLMALHSLYQYNFKSMRDVANTWRIFSLNDEKGAIICSFPHGKQAIPVPYYSETMTGFEYALAGLMISRGLENEGLELVRAIRDRYDGKKRNPWNEIECGSNYARAMASFALLPIYSRFKFDLPNGMLGFDPIHKDGFKSFFSVGTAWGTLSWNAGFIAVELCEGYLELKKFAVNADIRSVTADGKQIAFEYLDGIVCFDQIKIESSLVFSC